MTNEQEVPKWVQEKLEEQRRKQHRTIYKICAIAWLAVWFVLTQI